MGIPLLGNATTKEAIVRDMKAVEMNSISNETAISADSPVACITAEYAVLMGNHDIQMVSFMTDFYDNHTVWSYRTKTQGDIQVNGMCLTLLSACAPSWLPDIFTPRLMEGGLISRTIFVAEEGDLKIIPNPNKVERDKKVERNLLADLELMKSMRGEFIMTPEMEKIYEPWYVNERTMQKHHTHPLMERYIEGYVSRRPMMLLKLSMILSAMRDNDRRLLPEDFYAALGILEQVEVGMPGIMGGFNITKYGQQTKTILEYLRKRKQATQAQIMQRFPDLIDSYTFDIVCTNLIAAGHITNHRKGNTRTLTFIGETAI